MRTSSAGLLPLLCVLVPAAHAQVGATDLTDRFVAPAGARVTLWAESPLFFNPTAIDVDGAGNVWVAEAVNYRKWDGRNPGLDHPLGDRVVRLRDTDHDGVADESVVFAQDELLVSPLGVCVLGDTVLVSCSPHLLAYRDTDGDGKADERQVLLTGFGGLDHDHGLHSVVPGDDGWLYLAVGNAGPHLVDGPDGFRLRSGSIYTGGSPHNGHNAPGLVSSDGRVWTGGLLLRVRPDGSGLTVLSHNYRNEYEVARDAFGDLYTEDNDDDGNRSCRTVWAAEYGDQGFFGGGGSRTWQADRRPGQETTRAHWHADDPGVFPPGTVNGGGGPTGVCVYEWDSLPDLRGAVLNCDAGAGVVYAHRPRVEGAGMALDGDVFLGRTERSGRAADDGQGAWFRPSDVCVCPDGSVLVADWYDPGVGGHGMGDRQAYGRLLRVAPEGASAGIAWRGWGPKDMWHSTPPVRWAAREQLARDAELRAAYVERLRTLEDPRQLAHALTVALTLPDADVPELAALGLRHPDERVRAATLRAVHASPAGVRALRPLHFTLVEDPSPFVRATLARLLRDEEWEVARLPLLGVALAGPTTDRVLVESVGLAVAGHELEFLDILGAAADADRGTFEDLAWWSWRLHPAEHVATFESWVRDTRHTLAVRARVLEALAFVPTREACDAMFALARTGPEDLRASARQWLRQRARDDWRDFGLGGEGGLGLDAAQQAWSSGVVRGGRRALDLDVRGARDAWLVVTDAGDGNSCDWADWVGLRFVLEDGREVPLTVLGPWHESNGWGSLGLDRNCGGGRLAIDGVNLEGYGTHAPAQLAFEVPAGARRLVGEVGADDGGTSQGGGSTMEFQVWLTRAADRGELEALRAELLDPDTDPARRAELVRAFAADPEGALWLGAHSKQLDDDLRRAALETLDTNPDLGVRALARPTLQPADAAPAPFRADEVAALTGDPDRGAQVFRSERAQCARCHRVAGAGQDIGPDLSDVHRKLDRPALLQAVLEPSASIAFGYDSYVVLTTEGELLSGFLLSSDDRELVLRDTQGQRHVVPAEELDVVRKQELSVMPEGVALGLTPQELADLVAFLATPPRSGEPRFGEPRQLFDGRSLAGWTHHLEPDGDPADTWSVRDGVLRCVGRPAGYVRTTETFTNYELVVEWRFDPERGPGNSGVLLRVHGEDRVWPNSIEAQLQSGSAGDIWNIGEFPMRAAPERTNGRHTRRLLPSSEKPLGEWNRYRIRLDHGHLELEVNGVVQNVAEWCEVKPGWIALQSEGATIEFRKVELRPILD